jgi:glycosyltransferase involved in cell wall biosynthesis
MRLGIDASNIRAGGGVTHLVELLGAADPDSHGIDGVLVWGNRQTLAQLPTQPWLTVVHEPLLDRSFPLRLFWQATQLSQLAQNSCDILFVPGGSHFGSFRPLVTMSRNLLPFDRHERQKFGWSWINLRLSLLRLSQGYTFRRADGLIFLTKYACSAVMTQIKKNRGPLIIIPHGINRRFCLAPRPQKHIKDYAEDNPFRLLYVSDITVYKNQGQVAEGVARLKQAGLPIRLDLAGPAYPPALRHFHNITRRLDPEEKFIRYHGPVPYEELPNFYHRADMFVFASSCETISNTLLEAMASGLPIACSNRGPMPEVLGDAGVYFDPEKPDEIANALERLILGPALRAPLAQAAYERAQTYSWERCAHDTFAFLAQVARYFHGAPN